MSREAPLEEGFDCAKKNHNAASKKKISRESSTLEVNDMLQKKRRTNRAFQSYRCNVPIYGTISMNGRVLLRDQLWNSKLVASKWNMLNLEYSQFGMCSFWKVPFWNVPFLECALFGRSLFGMCPFWNVLFLEWTQFGMSPF